MSKPNKSNSPNRKYMSKSESRDEKIKLIDDEVLEMQGTMEEQVANARDFHNDGLLASNTATIVDGLRSRAIELKDKCDIIRSAILKENRQKIEEVNYENLRRIKDRLDNIIRKANSVAETCVLCMARNPVPVSDANSQTSLASQSSQASSQASSQTKPKDSTKKKPTFP